MQKKAGDVPVIDISPLVAATAADGAGEGGSGRAVSAPVREVAQQLDRACREHGFFYIVGHGVDAALQRELEALSRDFFARPLEEKMRIRMALGGRAWRGYFPVGDELTSGRPDAKEGLYFGAELGPDDPRVASGLAMHGANLFPEGMPELKRVVLDYLASLTRLGHIVMSGLALGLGLDRDFFARLFMTDPLILFRIFHYPAPGGSARTGLGDDSWGVGEHTDYGVLTLLKQDSVGGLQVKTRGRWINAPPVADSFICNIGDMLERMTGGLYRSTPHRVKNESRQGRLSFPFFFDPDFDARIERIVEDGASDSSEPRWDGADPHLFEGTYGDYVLAKVAKVFPDLG